MKTIVINREDRPERLAATKEQLDRFGIEFEVFPAVIGGWKGCRLSHLGVLEKYINEDRILIFEDDIHFLQYPQQALEKAFNELPEDWDLLYLGISPLKKYERYSEHLFKVNGGYTTHAILYNNRDDSVIEYILRHRDNVIKWDLFLSNVIHPLFKCFCIYPMTVTQRRERSDTCKYADVSSILRNYQKYCR